MIKLFKPNHKRDADQFVLGVNGRTLRLNPEQSRRLTHVLESMNRKYREVRS